MVGGVIAFGQCTLHCHFFYIIMSDGKQTKDWKYRKIRTMNERYNLTTGSISKRLFQFALPYLLACFLQTFYGMADLFVVGLYQGAAATAAVSAGSQVIHMLTVIVAGFTMGITVHLARELGAGDFSAAREIIGTGVRFFLFLGVALTIFLALFTENIADWMLTPVEAREQTIRYLRICFLGTPFIVTYNVFGSIFRGAGDSKSPLYFVGIACVVNVALDFLFVGYYHMGAAGAALATVIGQGVSSLTAFLMLRKRKFGLLPKKEDFKKNPVCLRKIWKVGAPIALQDGLIQVSFLLITVIANSRGLIMASSVGIVEKLIGFLFLVPSAFLSAISAITAQNVGAGKAERGRKTLWTGMAFAVTYGFCIALFNQICPECMVGLFTQEEAVLEAGCSYLRAYVWDVMFAAVHFCFNGYFCGNQKTLICFFHNIISIVLIRIPGAYCASIFFPDTLYPMGWAAPLGSLLSALICMGFYIRMRKKEIL